MLKFRKITGQTMIPAYPSGTIVAVRDKKVHVGDAVLARVNGNEVFKRVISRKNDTLTLANDHQPKNKTDIHTDDIIGVISFSLPIATLAPKPHKPYAKIIASVMAAVLMVMAALQLISFDTFIPIIENYWLLVDGAIVAALLVTLTVTALPFLLHMTISPLARLTSMMAGWGIAILWLALGLHAYIMPNALVSTGHLGGVVDTPPGVWMIFFGIAFCGLMTVSHWSLGLPSRRGKQ